MISETRYTVITLAEPWQRELLESRASEDVQLIWPDNAEWTSVIQMLRRYPAANVWMDLRLSASSDSRYRENGTWPPLVILHAVEKTLAELPAANACRVNAWPSFFERKLLESAAPESMQEQYGELVRLLGWEFIRVADIPGLLTARVVSQVVNEAWFAFGEAVSSPSEIDTAMKLGTNYPLGPFEWSERVGVSEWKKLLEVLSREGARYEMAPRLRQTEV